MAEKSPEASRAFAEGEARLRAGELRAAESSFARAEQLASTSGLAARRHAQVLTELGRKADAIAACRKAITLGRTAMDARACVAPLLLGPEPPTVDEVAEALRLVAWAKRMPNQPFGDAALCEIAYRLGDEAMLKHCVASMRAYAPDHYETRRWAAAIPRQQQWPRWLGFGAVLGAGALTLLHSQRRRYRSKSKAPLAAAAGVVALSFAPLVHAAEPAPAAMEKVAPREVLQDPNAQKDVHWQLSSSFPINPQNPETSVPTIEQRNKDPLEFGYYLQDLAADAVAAEKKNDFAMAARFWSTLVSAVPDVAPGYRRACKAYEQAGDLPKALEYCAGALNQRDVQLDDFGNHARLVLSKPKLEPSDVPDLEAMMKHLRESKEGQPALSLGAAHIECELGLRLEDAKRLQACTRVLTKAAPHDPKTLSFRWSYAMLRHDYADARATIAALKKAGLPESAIEKLTLATADASVWWKRPTTHAVALAVALLTAWLLLRRRRAAAPTADPPAAGPSTSPA